MTFSASVFFLGKYRPAYFEGKTLKGVIQAASNAVMNCEPDLRNRLLGYLVAGEVEMRSRRSNVTSWSAEYGQSGVSISRGPLDRPFLERLASGSGLTDCPGLNYALATI